MQCKLLLHTVPVGPPYYANSPITLVCQCETHGVVFNAPSVVVGELCIVGKIENAVDDGLAKIAAALATTTPKQDA